jgi:GT2 family glycosyltransferase/LmbE family N-acetylglucosaminyl deacetylase
MISAVVVSYRSASSARAALASFRDDARRTGIDAEAICVVNSGDPDEAHALEGECDRLLVPGSNLGYAGGLNAGIEAARGDILLLSNPDVVFLPGSVAALAAALEGADLALAGPAFFWDDATSLLLPPAEEPGPAEALRRVLARDPARGALVFRRAVRRALGLETIVREGRTAEADALSGALMAVTRKTLERVGAFDERYRLYYEENDWQRRLRSSGGRLLTAGAARVVHRYAQSSRHEPKADAWFRESERLYFEEHFGERGRASLERAEASAPEPFPEPPRVARLAWEPGRDALVAVSPFASFRPLILAWPARGAATFRLPPDVLAAHPESRWYARAVDAGTFETLSEGLLTPAPARPSVPAASSPGPASSPRDPFPERHLLPYETTRFVASRVLVVAPHADDETLGCGGTLAGLLADGARVDVLVVTDGAGDEADPDRRRETGELRLAETRRALAALGGGSARCAFLPDRGLCSLVPDVSCLLEETLLETLPDLVFVPSPVEVHPDHRAVAEAFLSAFSSESGRRLSGALPNGSRAAFYEVSQPIRPNVLVDVSPHALRKETAVAAFASQLPGRDYAGFSRGLSDFRRLSLPSAVTAAEGFFVAPLGALPSIDPGRLARAIGPTLRSDEVLSGPAPTGRPDSSPPHPAGPLPAPSGDAPLVSVVVRTKNRHDLLREALASVAADPGVPLEVVVVNDGGEDVSDILGEFPGLRVRYVDLRPGRGRAAAANAGTAAASGRFLHFLDDDDLLLPGGLAALAAAAGEDEVVYGRVDAYRWSGTGEGRIRTPFHSFAEPFDEVALLLENFIPLNAPLLPREAVLSAGGFDESLERFEDWDLFLRLSTTLRFRLVDVPVAEYRVFPSHFIDDPEAARTQEPDRVAVLRKHADRYSPEALSRLLLHVKRERIPREVNHEVAALEALLARSAETAARGRDALAAERDEAERRASDARGERASVVIVNYNGRHHLEKCLPSLERSVPRPGEVILVDNGSADDSLAWVRAHHPWVKVLPMGANLGFGEANRRGALGARGDLLVLLNSDTVVEEGWLGPLLAPLCEGSEVAASCSTLRLLATPELLNGLGGGMSRLAYAFDHGFRFPYEEWAPQSGEPRRRDVLFPTAAAMAMRRNEFLDVGGFDPAFFMYHEDVDLGWRLWLLGRRVVVCRDSVVRHAFLGTSKAEKGLDWRLKLGVRHAVRSVLVNVEPLEAAKVLKWHAVLLARAGAWRLLAHVVAWNLRHLPGTVGRRADLNARRKRSSSDLRALGLVSRALQPPPPPEPPRFRGGPCDQWIPADELLPGEFSGESRLGWGWYSREDDGSGPFRWTCGMARFGLRVAPGEKGLLRLVVKGSCAAPMGEMSLTVGGRKTPTDLGGAAWHEVELPVIAGPDGLLDVVLRSPSAVPDEVVGNWDFRRLGAAVRSVRFSPAEQHLRRRAETLSVVIPTYNRREVLEETVRSLARQTSPPLEAIVVDDGSTDGSHDLLLALREELKGRLEVVPLRQPNLKQGRARNLGVAKAKGDLVLFLGDDTIPDPDCVAEHLAAHHARPGPCAVIGYTGWYRERMRVTPFLDFVNGHGPQFSFDFLRDGQEVPFTTLYTSNVSIPREALGSDPFDHRFTSYGWEDCELGRRLSSAGLPIVYRRSAATRHVHPQTMSQFLTRMAHVGRAIDVLYEIHPELDGSPWLPPRNARWRHRTFSFAYRAASRVAALLDLGGVRLPVRLYHALVAWAFHSSR